VAKSGEHMVSKESKVCADKVGESYVLGRPETDLSYELGLSEL
jgi:hypothetical protein